MNISRRAFLATTTAFTTINLFGMGSASAEINPASLNRNHWYSVWFQPGDKKAIRMGQFSGIERYALPEDTFLTLDGPTRQKLARARPGDGLKQEVTVHYVQDPVPEFNPTTGEGMYKHPKARR